MYNLIKLLSLKNNNFRIAFNNTDNNACFMNKTSSGVYEYSEIGSLYL